MAHYSKEQKDEFKSIIRSMIVRKPDLSIRQIVDLLANNPKRPIKLGKNYVHALVKHIRRDRKKRIDYYILNEVLGKFEDEVEEMKQILFGMIQSREVPARTKIAAIKEYRDSSLALFDKMFDAGVFERKLGTVDTGRVLTQEERDLLNRAIEYAFRPKSSKLNKDSGGSKSEKGGSRT